MIRAVVFDLGQVLASPPNVYEDAAARLGVPAADYESHYWTERHGYDQGVPDAEYWGPILTRLGLTPTDDDIAAAAGFDADLWVEIRPEAHQLLRDSRAAGRAVAILSNSPHAIAAACERAAWRPDVDHVFVSAPLGAAKPDARAYELVQADLGVDPHQIAFIDDKQDNVDGALAVGWQAHLWRDDSDTRAWLEQIGVL